MKITPTDDLITWDLGKFEGKKQTDEAQGHIDDMLINDPDEPISTGESFVEFSTRVLTKIKEILKTAPNDTLVITHNACYGLIKLWYKEGKPTELDKKFRETYTKQDSDTADHFIIYGDNGAIYVMRHGETQDNVDKRFRREDTTLTEKGIEQVKKAARELKDEHIPEIICSSLSRALNTADITSEILDKKQDMKTLGGIQIKKSEKKEEEKEVKDSKLVAKDTKPYADFVGYLLNCEKYSEMAKITTHSYDIHKILAHYNCDVREHIYCLAKMLTIEVGELKGFGNYSIGEYESMEPLEYFEDAKEYIESIRDGLLKDCDKTVTSAVGHVLKCTNNCIYHLRMAK